MTHLTAHDNPSFKVSINLECGVDVTLLRCVRIVAFLYLLRGKCAGYVSFSTIRVVRFDQLLSANVFEFVPYRCCWIHHDTRIDALREKPVAF